MSKKNRILQKQASVAEISLWIHGQIRHGKIIDPVLIAALEELQQDAHSKGFYEQRVISLDKLFRKMPEPWRTLCADIIANGKPRFWGIGIGIVDE